MNEQTYQGDNNANNSGVYRFLVGLLTGVVAAAPISAFITRKICNRQKDEAVRNALIEASKQAIQPPANIHEEVSMNSAGSAEKGLKTPNRGICDDNLSENDSAAIGAIPVYVEQADKPGTFIRADGGTTYNEAYLASMQSPSDDDRIDYDLENYDLKIDDEEATEDAQRFSEERVRYLDMVEKYKNQGGDIPPMMISREQFDNEHFYEKAYVNWYEDDDVFEEDNCKIEDPGYMFGYSTGREMFAPNLTANREDPDICYIRNMKQSTDFEITRMHGSYEKNVIEGEVYYRGEAGPQF